MFTWRCPYPGRTHVPVVLTHHQGQETWATGQSQLPGPRGRDLVYPEAGHCVGQTAASLAPLGTWWLPASPQFLLSSSPHPSPQSLSTWEVRTDPGERAGLPTGHPFWKGRGCVKGATEGEMRPPCTGPRAGQGCPLLVGSGHGLRARCTHMQACMWHVWWHVCLGAGGCWDTRAELEVQWDRCWIETRCS